MKNTTKPTTTFSFHDPKKIINYPYLPYTGEAISGFKRKQTNGFRKDGLSAVKRNNVFFIKISYFLKKNYMLVI